VTLAEAQRNVTPGPSGQRGVPPRAPGGASGNARQGAGDRGVPPRAPAGSNGKGNGSGNGAGLVAADNSPSAAAGVFDKEKDLAQEVRAGLQIFVVAVKNCGLYPANNKIRQASMERVTEWFTTFLEEHETLRLFVDMDGFLFQGIQVLQENPTESAIIFPFFRDGVQWIEFLEGLDSKELLTLMEHMNRFRILKEEDEDDLVTAMWTSDFQFIKYKTANEFWEIDPVTEISSLKVGFDSGQEQPKKEKIQYIVAPISRDTMAERKTGGKTIGALLSWMNEGGPNVSNDSKLFQRDGELLPPSTGIRGGDGDGEGEDDEDFLEGGYRQYQTWAISPAEKAEMERILAEESKKGHLGMGIDLTLALIPQKNDPESRVPILKFLADIVKFALARADFQSVLILLKKLAYLIQAYSPDLDNLKTEFPGWLAEEAILEGILHTDPKQLIPPEQIVSLRKFLRFLPSGVNKTLVNIASKLKDESLKFALLEAAVMRAAAGGIELSLHANTVLHPDDLTRMYKYFENKDIKNVFPFLSGGAKHVKRQVREVAARIILESDPNHISSLPHLLAEPEPSLARQIYFLLGQGRNPVVEKILINFLNNTIESSINRSPELIMLCYRTLGLVAASTAATEFASSKLMKKDFRSFIGFSSEMVQTHRTGGALALYLMPPSLGADEILSRASRSFFRSLRQACADAKKEADSYRRRFLSHKVR
jgi:hypothetical protein